MSANTLRNYEVKGLIPPAERSSNGYRMYSEQHEDFLACIQAMSPAFGMEVTTKVLHCLQRNEIDDALWTIREREVLLYRKKASLDQLVIELKSIGEGHQACDFSQRLSIHEVSSRTGTPKSTIRYWEQSGLFSTQRNPDNGYRLYSEADLLKIRMIQLMQNCVYSEEAVNLKMSIALLEMQNIEHAMKLADCIRVYLNNTIKLQMQALCYLYRLIQALGFSKTIETQHR